jgi:hypothetical protein
MNIRIITSLAVSAALALPLGACSKAKTVQSCTAGAPDCPAVTGPGSAVHNDVGAPEQQK